MTGIFLRVAKVSSLRPITLNDDEDDGTIALKLTATIRMYINRFYRRVNVLNDLLVIGVRFMATAELMCTYWSRALLAGLA